MRILTIMTVGLMLVGVAATGRAEVTTDQRALTLEGAKRVISAAVVEAKRLNAPGGSLAVVDEGGNLLALERLDHTFAASANIAIGKARTAALFKKPTKAFEEAIKNGRTSMVTLGGDLQNFTPLQGGQPLTWEGRVVGAIGVSGAASAQQDENLAVAGAAALESMDVSAEPTNHTLPVTYLDTRTVKAAFDKGAVLVGEDENMMHAARNYMVHASHRDKPGVAEVHTLDTDIVYVLEGTATLVTGGKAVDPKTIAPNEIRGKYIEGGETRKLVPGDVVIIPNPVPHWFKEVSTPFNYYVVKVR